VAKIPRDVLGEIAAQARDALILVSLADQSADEDLLNERITLGFENTALIYGTYYQAALETLVEHKDEALSKALPHPDLLEALSDQWQRLEKYAEDRSDVPLLRTQAFLALSAGALLESWALIALIRHIDSDSYTSLAATARAEAVERASLLSEAADLFEGDCPAIQLLLKLVGPPTFQGVADALRVERQVTDLAAIGHSALRPGDLNLLARRDEESRKAYGTTLERAFERQLSLLFTSLGLAVIESTPGRRYVDLVCIGADPQPQTLVVEAKSTSRSQYEFRAADQRALIEHVEEVKGSLRGLPPVELVLIVAPNFSRGAAKRVSEAEAKIGIPCRGLPSTLLVDLRQRHLGPISSAVLIDELRRGPIVASDDTIDAIVEIAQAPSKGWQEFVGVLRHAARKRS
jgi:hypothetical protein